MELLVILALIVFSGIMCYRSFKLILHPEQHWHDTIRKLQKDHGDEPIEEASKKPSMRPIRVIGIIGASATGVACLFLTVAVIEHLNG